jgi:hypothetical protein
MTTVRRLLCFAALTTLGVLIPAGFAGAIQNPTTGQPGASSGVTCFSSSATMSAPGNSMSAAGSVFNPSGTAGTVYAGNMGTASLAHSNSMAAVSQYDIACLHVTQH